MKWLALLLLLMGGSAAAHPIEPLVTRAPMPVPRDYVALDVGYGALHQGSAFQQDVPLSLAAGIGGHAEVFVGGRVDATVQKVGPISVGGKLLLMMEGARGIDLAVSASFGSDSSVHGGLLAGRTLLPGIYLQAAGTIDAISSTATTTLGILPLNAMLRHDVGPVLSGNTVAVTGASALQWAVRPRIIPTFEVQATRIYFETTKELDIWIVPEIIYLLEINHLAIKAGTPIGITGATDFGVLTSIAWER